VIVAPPWGRETVRRQLTRHIHGEGLELGPGHVPFPLDPLFARVTYVDRWKPDENRALFPELDDDASFPEPDIVLNLDADLLRPLTSESQDFVIASHVLEHVANPLALLDDIHRVLKADGLALLLLPDRHSTFDRERRPTPLAHLVGEYEASVTEVSDEHIVEFVESTTPADNPVAPEVEDGTWPSLPLGRRVRMLLDAPWANVHDDRARRAIIDFHRKRSIHVHVWDVREFVEVLVHANAVMGHGWELVDGSLPSDWGGYGMEFGYLLRKSRPGLAGMAPRLRASFESWLGYRQSLIEAQQDFESALSEAQAHVSQLQAQVDQLSAQVDHLGALAAATPSARFRRLVRRVVAR
jgi:SAM-dependent methyltransferase